MRSRVRSIQRSTSRAFRSQAVETSKISFVGENLLPMLLNNRRRYWYSKWLILSSGKGHDQVTDMSHKFIIRKIHRYIRGVAHVLCAILLAEYNGDGLLPIWTHLCEPTCKDRSRSGQKRSNFEMFNFEKIYVSGAECRRESNGAVFFLYVA